MEKTGIRISVKSPASTANLGAGYDCISIAVDLWNHYEMHVDLSPFNSNRKEYEFRFLENQYYDVDPKMRSSDGNLFVRAFDKARKFIFHKSNKRDYKRNILVLQNNQIPPIRGLGSSSSASVAGILAGFEYAEQLFPDINLTRLGIPKTNKRILELARDVDSCPDNICASLEGGITTVFLGDPDEEFGQKPIYHFSEKILDENLRLIFLIPNKPIPTTKARSLLDNQSYSIEDCSYNITRATCIPQIFRGKRYELLGEALKDKIHQRQRTRLYGENQKHIDVESVFNELLKKSPAYGACISGAGSSLLAIADEKDVELVAENFRAIFENHIVISQVEEWKVQEIRIHKPNNSGAICNVTYTY